MQLHWLIKSLAYMVAFSQDMHDLYNDKLIGAERCIIAMIEYQHNGCVE